MGIKGNIEDISLPDLFQIVSLSQRSGKLIIESQRGKANIIFNQGRIIQAFTTPTSINIGKVLIEQKFINSDQLLEAIQHQRTLKEWKQLGSICISKKFITMEQLEESIKLLVTKVIAELLEWDEGLFSFEVGSFNVDDDINIDMRELMLRKGLSSDFLIMEGSKLLEEKINSINKENFVTSKLFQKRISPEELIVEPDKTEGTDDLFKKLIGELDPDSFDILSKEAPPEQGIKRSDEDEWIIKVYEDVKRLKELLRKVDHSMLFLEFSFAIMQFVSGFIERVLLFMVSPKGAKCLGHMGISEHLNLLDSEIRSFRIPLDIPNIISDAYTSGNIFKGKPEKNNWNDFFINKIGISYDHEILVMPVTIGGEIKFILYADNYPQNSPIKNFIELESFIYQAGMALEIIILEKRIKESKNN